MRLPGKRLLLNGPVRASVAVACAAGLAFVTGPAASAQSVTPNVWIPDFDISTAGAQADGQLYADGGDLVTTSYVSDTACDSHGALLQIKAGGLLENRFDGHGCGTTAEWTDDWAGSTSLTHVQVRVCRVVRNAVGDYVDKTCSSWHRINKSGHW